MGQEGLFQFLEKLKCSGVPVSTRDLMGVCGEIDLFGTYMPLILRELRHGDTQVKPYEIGRKVGYQLSKHWDMAMLTVYLDGEQSDQKLKARTARGIVRVKNMRELESLLGKMETYSINGKWAPRSIVSTIKKRLGTVYSITDAFKDELQRGIMDSGCTRFVCCEGEADVAIAEELMVRPTLELNGQTFWRMPVSSDSDLLIYASLPGLFRRLRDGTFVLLTKEKVLATLGFQHPRQLVLYGTVSRNDYVTNIRTIGLSKNRDIIRDLIIDWNADMDVLLEAYLLEANSRVAVDDRVDKGHFRHSIAMFFDLRPTYDEKLPSATNMQYMEFSLKFSHLKALRVERKSEQPRSAPKFYIAPGSKPNQYRPTFGSKDTILGSKTRAFRVCDTKERRMPEPRKDPKTKRGKQEVQYQRTQKPVKRKNRVPKEGEPTYEAGHKNKLKASTVVDHRLSRKHPTSTLLVGSVHANIKRALKVPWGSDDDHDDGEGLADLEKEPRIHEVAGQEDTLVDNINAEQEDKEEQNPDAHVLSTSLSNAIGTIQLLRIQLYEVLALDLDRIFGPKLPPGTSSVTLQAPSIASATFQPLAHITPTSSSSVLSPLSPLATPSTDMSPMDTPQPTQKLPGPACTIEQLNLSSADRQDIGDIVSTSLTFYYQVVSLMLNGSLSNNSQYERNRSAPERTMPTRSNKTASRAPLVVPHSVRAYEHYCAVTGVVPFNLRPGATAMTTTVPRLAAISVQTSFRQHYLASSFSGDDGKDLEPPKDNVDRVCWFHIHNWTRDEYAHFPKSRFTPTFVHLSEADMLEVFYLDETARAIALERLEVKTISQARKLVVEKKGLLIQLLLYPVEADLMPRPSGYHDNLTLQSNGRTSKLKLRGTICSNGLELHLLAYDTTKLRRSPKNKDGSTDDCSGSDADLDGLFDEPGEDEDDLLDEPVLDLDDSECVMTPKRRRLDSVAGSISDGESTNAGLIQHGGEPIPRSGGGTSRSTIAGSSSLTRGTPMVTNAGSVPLTREDTTMEPVWKINYGRGSKLLPNVEKEFETPVQCVDWDSRPIVSVDPGEKKPFCAIRMGPRSGPRTEDNKSEREVLNVSKAFLYRPVVEFRNAHQHRLASVDLDLVVSGIPPLRIGAVERYLAYLESASTGQNSEETEGQKGHPGDERTVRARIEDFYIRNRWFVKKSWDAKKAQNASYNYVLKAMLGLVGGSEGRKFDGDKPPIFAFGLGDFNTRTGLSSKHSSLEKFFVVKAKALGYSVVGVHEFYTSARCPRVDCLEFLKSGRGRSRYCEECKIFVDRDVVGAENIGQVVLSQLREQQRPTKFMAPDTPSNS